MGARRRLPGITVEHRRQFPVHRLEDEPERFLDRVALLLGREGVAREVPLEELPDLLAGRGLDAADIGRPLTHDLLLDVTEELGGRVERVDISDLRDGTYIADLHLATPREEAVVDSRPSDALALAARTNAPISVVPEVFDAGKEVPAEFEELSDIREVVTDE